MHNYRELKVWNKAIDLVTHIYEISKEFPNEEKYGIISQMRRSAVSIPSNISEGAGRNSDKEFIQFLGIAQGSSFELQTQIIISYKLNYITNKDFEKLNNSIEEVEKMIYGFQSKLKSNV